MSRKINELSPELVVETEAPASTRIKRTKNKDSDSRAKAKKKTAPVRKTRSLSKQSPLKTEAVGEAVELTEMSMKVDEVIPKIDEQPEAQGLPLAIDRVADSEVIDTAPHEIRPMPCSSTVPLPEQPCEGALGSDVPVFTHLTKMGQSTRLSTILHWLGEAWNWMQKLGSRPTKKRLRVCESVSLGEKRFVAVIEVDGEQFLVGGASSSVVTLARLEPTPDFSEVLKRRWAHDAVQA